MSLFLYPQLITAIEIHDIRWGFNNRPVAFKVNPVSILVENNEPTPFESEIQFRQKTFRGQQVDIVLSASTYVAPFEKKWLQFYPYFTESASNWEASWTNGKSRAVRPFLSPQPITGNVTVQLVQPNNLSRVIPGIKQYPEELFPPLLGALDSLDCVILDHVPMWEKSRRITFLQWIFLGGIVHIFENPNGSLPHFPKSYAPLNRTDSSILYGSGMIYRHKKHLSDVTPSELTQLLVKKNSDEILSLKTKEDQATTKLKQSVDNQGSEYVDFHSTPIDEELLIALTEISKPKQIWYFIFLLSFIYLLVAGPGYYLIAKHSKFRNAFYRVYFIGTALFCLIFLIIGQYSTNRTSQIHSLIIANMLPNNEIDITEWSSLGIASGGHFKISHTGKSHIYSTCQKYSKVNGIMTCGNEGKILVDIPANSSRTFFHRGRTSATVFNVKVNSFLSNELGLETLSLEIDKIFLDQIDQVHFLFGAKLYELKKESNRLEYRGTSRKLSSLLEANPLSNSPYLTAKRVSPFVNQQNKQSDLALKQFSPLLLQRALKIESQEQKQEFHLPNNYGKLLVFSSIPDELFPESPDISRKEGLVLYCLDVPLTGQAD